MLHGKKVLAVIPARGESRKVSGKHLRKVAGRTLLGWTIHFAQKSRYIDQLILSSDDLLIIQEAKNYGCDVPFLRPKHLARADTPYIAPILHAIDMLPGYDYIVVLQPSSPLRSTEDIDNCLVTCVENNVHACISVSEPNYRQCYSFTMQPNNKLIPTVPGQLLTHRQAGEVCYMPNGAVEVAEIPWLKREQTFLTTEILGYVMPRERSIDVDSELDLWLVNSYKEFMAQRAPEETLEPAESSAD
jgi:CMP-N,N'-diacetyllegionaminic acid synthase